MSEYDKGLKAGKAKATIACIVLVLTFLGGRYGRDIPAPSHHESMEVSQYIDMPPKY